MGRALFLLLALSSASYGQIAYDDFEDLGPDGTTFDHRIIGGVYVAIRNHYGGDLPSAQTYFEPPQVFRGALGGVNAPLNPEDVSGSRFISCGSGLHGNPVRIDFYPPVFGFGLTTVDLLQNSTAPYSVVFLRGLDSNLQFLTEQARHGGQGLSGLDLDWWITSAQGISTALLIGAVFGADDYGLDDFAVQLMGPIGIEQTSWAKVRSLYR